MTASKAKWSSKVNRLGDTTLGVRFRCAAAVAMSTCKDIVVHRIMHTARSSPEKILCDLSGEDIRKPP